MADLRTVDDEGGDAVIVLFLPILLVDVAAVLVAAQAGRISRRNRRQLRAIQRHLNEEHRRRQETLRELSGEPRPRHLHVVPPSG
jgi:hypothetical protein